MREKQKKKKKKIRYSVNWKWREEFGGALGIWKNNKGGGRFPNTKIQADIRILLLLFFILVSKLLKYNDNR